MSFSDSMFPVIDDFAFNADDVWAEPVSPTVTERLNREYEERALEWLDEDIHIRSNLNESTSIDQSIEIDEKTSNCETILKSKSTTEPTEPTEPTKLTHLQKTVVDFTILVHTYSARIANMSVTLNLKNKEYDRQAVDKNVTDYHIKGIGNLIQVVRKLLLITNRNVSSHRSISQIRKNLEDNSSAIRNLPFKIATKIKEVQDSNKLQVKRFVKTEEESEEEAEDEDEERKNSSILQKNIDDFDTFQRKIEEINIEMAYATLELKRREVELKNELDDVEKIISQNKKKEKNPEFELCNKVFNIVRKNSSDSGKFRDSLAFYVAHGNFSKNDEFGTMDVEIDDDIAASILSQVKTVTEHTTIPVVLPQITPITAQTIPTAVVPIPSVSNSSIKTVFGKKFGKK